MSSLEEQHGGLFPQSKSSMTPSEVQPVLPESHVKCCVCMGSNKLIGNYRDPSDTKNNEGFGPTLRTQQIHENDDRF
jgi:hypothetical protein